MKYYAETARTTHKTMAAARAAEVRALRAQGGGQGGIYKVTRGQTYLWRTVGVDSLGTVQNRSRKVRKSTGWIKAKAVRIEKRGRQYVVKVKR